MSERENSPTELHAEEPIRLIRHLRKKPQSFIETIGGWRREAKRKIREWLNPIPLWMIDQIR